MSKKVSIVDYGVGNLFSVARAFERQGATVELVKTPQAILAADSLVFPGVGAFKEGVRALKETELWPAIGEYTKKGNPFIGICLGMQMMLDKSFEFGETEGLGLIAGEVCPIPETTTGGELFKVPAIGWYPLIEMENPWSQTILKGFSAKDSVYFVHSYYTKVKDSKNILAAVNYGGHKIPAALVKGHMLGCQFHPERSGPVGLNIVQHFLHL